MSAVATSQDHLRDAPPALPSWRLPLPRLAEHRLTVPLTLIPLCAILFFHGLTAGDLYRTESLRAIIAQEFLNSGNWVVPTLYGEPLLTKPPGMYAAIAAVSWPLGGVTTWSARLPSALAATATVWLVFWSFRRSLGRLGGLAAACVVPTSVMWLDKATSAEIDMLQVFWVTASLLFFLRALEAEEDGAKPRAAQSWWVAALLCVAGGVLTKWTAPAFFYLTAVPLLAWRGRLRLLFRRHHLIAAALGASVVFVWIGLAVRQVGWDAFATTVGQEAMQRLVPKEVPVAPPHHHHRAYPWREVLGHPLVVGGACLPWSPLVLVTLWPGFARLWDERGRRLVQMLHCWVWPNLLFWTLVPEHAPRHSFPLFPGVAGLAALVWVAWLTGRLRWPVARLKAGTVFVAVVVAWLIVKVGFVHAVIPKRMHHRDPLLKGRQVAALIPDGETLYLFRLKDEGILFYYGRAVRRLSGPEALPKTSEPVYCIVTETEWRRWAPRGPHEVLLRLPDQQGAPILLVKCPRTDGVP